MNGETINIAFISDNNYFLCTSIAVFSLKTHRALGREYNIYIIYDGMNNRNIVELESMSDPGFNVLCVNARKKVGAVHFGSKKNARHVSSTATYKFYLDRILPDVNKLLYLDGDLLIRDGLEELFDINIDGKYAAVCQDIGGETFPSNYKERLHINHKYYFNTGVMLLNLQLIRKEGLDEKLVDYRKHGINDFMDQDTFNVVFSDNIVCFDIVYNMATSCWANKTIEEINAYYRKDFKSKADCYTQAKILHLTTPEKPWVYSDVIASEEWIVYYLNSPIYSNAFSRKLIGKSKYKKKIEGEMEYYSAVSSIQTNIQISTMEPAVVSVIIPVYNVESYLPDCIDSLLFQTLKNVEFIFVDDDSNDNTCAIIDAYSRFDSRIKRYSQPHGGAGKARNLGLEHVNTEYVTFLDGDDLLVPTALERLYSKAISSNADIVICGDLIFSEDKTATIKDSSSLRKQYLPDVEVFSWESHPDYLFQISDGQVWGKLFRMDFIKKNSIVFPPLPRTEDAPFTCLALSLAERLTYVDEELVLHRVIAGSNSLEESKDKNPTTSDASLRLQWNNLCKTGKREVLFKSFVNRAIMGYHYNFSTMKTAAGFYSLYDAFKSTMNEIFMIPFDSDDMIYDKSKAAYLKEIYDSESVQEYLYGIVIKKNNNSDLDMLYNSYALKIGKIIVWFPRKLHGLIQCYKDNGLRYTVHRFIEHIRGQA